MKPIDLQSLPLPAAVAAALSASPLLVSGEDVELTLDSNDRFIIIDGDTDRILFQSGGPYDSTVIGSNTTTIDGTLFVPGVASSSAGTYSPVCVTPNGNLGSCDSRIPKRVEQTVRTNQPIGNGQFSGTARATCPGVAQAITGGSGSGTYAIIGDGRFMTDTFGRYNGWIVSKVSDRQSEQVTAWAVCVALQIIDQSPPQE